MYLLGYDIGSSSVKAALLDAGSGRSVATAFQPKNEAPIMARQRGWAEQDPQMWWDNLRLATAELLSKVPEIKPSDIKAIGISYQMHGLVCVGEGLKPLRPAIIWCDSRAVPYGEAAFKGIGEQTCLRHLLNSPGNFTAAKLAWVKENEPETFSRIRKIMLPGDWIAAKMTGEICTTRGGLSEAILWDFLEDAPAGFVLDWFGFDRGILPEVRDTFSEQGLLSREAAAELGLAEGTPVSYRAGDQPNNAFSLGATSPGEIASTAGTSGVVYGVNGHAAFDPQSRVNSFAHVNHSAGRPSIGVLLCINGTGILNSWARRCFAPEGAGYEDMNRLAASAPIGSGGVCILPFGNGAERMLGNRDPLCSIHGLGFNTHGREHLLRAVQEGIVFSFMYGMEIMQGMGMNLSCIHAGNANMFLSDIFRDTLAGVSGAVIRLYDTDGAAGAARGAGLGAGIYGSLDETYEGLHCIREVEPSQSGLYREAYGHWKDILIKNIQ